MNARHKEEALIAALLTEPNCVEAAVKAGVSETTMHRWMRRPAFQAKYRAARRAVVEAAIGKLQAACGKAVDALVRALACGKTANEIRAALGILTHSIRAVELLDVIERVEELERVLGTNGHETVNADREAREAGDADDDGQEA
jgi:hypothetical protein